MLRFHVRSLLAVTLGGVLLMGALGCTHAQRASALPAAVPDALAWLVGDWVGTRTEASTGDRAPVISHIASVLGGVGQLETLEIRTPKGLYRGLFLQLFDPRLAKSVLIYVNANRREFVRLEGTAGATRAEWQAVSPERAMRSRLLLERIAPNQLRRTQFVSQDEGVTWSVLFVDDLHRS